MSVLGLVCAFVQINCTQYTATALGEPLRCLEVPRTEWFHLLCGRALVMSTAVLALTCGGYMLFTVGFHACNGGTILRGATVVCCL